MIILYNHLHELFKARLTDSSYDYGSKLIDYQDQP